MQMNHISWADHKRARKPGLLAAGIGAASLVALYVVVLAFGNSLQHAFETFRQLWYWMLPIILGFGTQMGLFVYVRKLGARMHSSTIVASTGTGSMSMIACCAHHLVDVLPLMGLAGLAGLLAVYQNLFLLAGVISVFAGLGWTLRTMRKHALFPEEHSSLLGLAARVRADLICFVCASLLVLLLLANLFGLEKTL